MRALLEALLLEEAARLVVEVEPLAQLVADRCDRAAQLLLRRDVVRAGEDGVAVELAHAPCRAADRSRVIASISSPKNSMRIAVVLLVRREDLDDVAAHAERAAVEVDVVALVLDVDERAEQLVAAELLAASRAR